MRRVVALVALLAVVGCEEDTPPPTSSSTSPAPSAATGSGCAIQALGLVDAGSVLIPGPVNGVPASDAVGEKLTITATVLDPGCRPASGAEVRVWHTDARGLYAPPGGQDECCFFGGTVRSDQNGRFRLDTIRPAKYPEPGGPPAHIHFEIRHTSGELDTEIVFQAGAPTAGPIGPSHVLPVLLRASGHDWYGEATFVLQP